MRSQQKRRRSESLSESEIRSKAPRTEADCNDPAASFNGSYQVETNLRSHSKAARNDPKLQSDWEANFFKRLRELKNKSTAGRSESLADENSEPKLVNALTAPEQVDSRKPDKVTPMRPLSSHTSSSCDDEDKDEDEEDCYDNNFDMDSLDDNSNYGSEYDEFACFKWLEQMDGKILWTSPDGLETTTVGKCSGKLIRRTDVRAMFDEEMEGPSDETSDLCFGLFDRYGRLKPELRRILSKKDPVYGKTSLTMETSYSLIIYT